MSQQAIATFEGLPVAQAKVEQAKSEIDFNNPTLTLKIGRAHV